MLKPEKIILVTLSILLAVVVVLGLLALPRPEVRNLDSRGKNIICFGDSITLGYGANLGEDYPSLLGKMTNYPVINAGVDGDTSPEAIRRFAEDALAKEPLLVIIEIGGNDFLKKIPLAVTLKNVAEMVEEAEQQGAMVAVADISAGMFLRDYRVAFSKLAKEKEAIFIPSLLSGIITNPSMKSDFIHPNAAGYKIIAHKVYRCIIPYLNKNFLLREAKK